MKISKTSWTEQEEMLCTLYMHIAVVELIEAPGKWVEESLLKQLCQTTYFSIMANECTDVATIDEMSVFCRWEEDGVPEEHFLEIVHLKKADAESIYFALVKCLKEKRLAEILEWVLMEQVPSLERKLECRQGYKK